MAVTPDKVQIGTSQDYLDGVAVDTDAGTGLFRETVVLADPEAGGGLANVRDLGTQLLMTDKGVVTNTIVHGKTAQGNIVDIKANPSGALAVDASGSSVSVSNFPTSPATGGNTSVNASTTQVTLLAANANRKGATIYNDSTLNALKVSLGPTASATSFTVVIASSGYYEVPFGYTGVITGIFATAIGAARITEVV